tara:strand:+ start:767 stop:934 length:168 start_codon:yes stop_codon:yes gene_type:complete
MKTKTNLKEFSKYDLIKNLNLIHEENENFECYLINILDNEELTNKEKIKLIREKI